MTTPKIEAAIGLHVIPQVAPNCRLTNESSSPPASPITPKTR